MKKEVCQVYPPSPPLASAVAEPPEQLNGVKEDVETVERPPTPPADAGDAARISLDLSVEDREALPAKIAKAEQDGDSEVGTCFIVNVVSHRGVQGRVARVCACVQGVCVRVFLCVWGEVRARVSKHRSRTSRTTVATLQFNPVVSSMSRQAWFQRLLQIPVARGHQVQQVPERGGGGGRPRPTDAKKKGSLQQARCPRC